MVDKDVMGSALWKEYYLELEPERRAQILERLLKEVPDDGSDRFRKKLFELRYLETDHRSREVDYSRPSVDRYLWQCVNFVQLYETSRFFKRGARREVTQFLSGNGYIEAMEAGPDGERALYWEIRNAARRFFKTCSGTEYRRALFGLMSPGKADQKNQMCLDTWKMTEGIAHRLGIAKDLSVWTKAVMDEYHTTDPLAEDRMRKLILERGPGKKQ